MLKVNGWGFGRWTGDRPKLGLTMAGADFLGEKRRVSSTNAGLCR